MLTYFYAVAHQGTREKCKDGVKGEREIRRRDRETERNKRERMRECEKGREIERSRNIIAFISAHVLKSGV